MFALYLAMMIFIGVSCIEKKGTVDGYVLGGRSMGSWVTALSAQASDMSGWLLMGLPGVVYIFLGFAIFGSPSGFLSERL